MPASTLPVNEEFPDDAPAPRPSGARALLLALVFAGSAFMVAHHAPGAAYFLKAGEAADCGGEAAAMPREAFCRLGGHVADLEVLVAGDPGDPKADLRARSAGRKLYVRLWGQRVFAVLAADRDDVLAWRERHAGALPGFEVEGTGRLFDPDGDAVYAGVAATLRQRYGIPAHEPIRLFDTTDQPMDRWPAALAVALMTLNAALALTSLIRVAWRLRRPPGPPPSVPTT
jgi:hypothetical protein